MHRVDATRPDVNPFLLMHPSISKLPAKVQISAERQIKFLTLLGKYHQMICASSYHDWVRWGLLLKLTLKLRKRVTRWTNRKQFQLPTKLIDVASLQHESLMVLRHFTYINFAIKLMLKRPTGELKINPTTFKKW